MTRTGLGRDFGLGTITRTGVGSDFGLEGHHNTHRFREGPWIGGAP